MLHICLLLSVFFLPYNPCHCFPLHPNHPHFLHPSLLCFLCMYCITLFSVPPSPPTHSNMAGIGKSKSMSASSDTFEDQKLSPSPTLPERQVFPNRRAPPPNPNLQRHYSVEDFNRLLMHPAYLASMLTASASILLWIVLGWCISLCGWCYPLWGDVSPSGGMKLWWLQLCHCWY